MDQEFKNKDQKNESKTSAKKASVIDLIRQHFIVIITFCIVSFLLIFLISNSSSLVSFFSSIFAVVLPILLGAAMAYIINPLLKIFEFKVFKKIENKKVLRILSLLMTYISVFLFIAAFLLLIIPQLIDSIKDFSSNLGTYLSKTTDLINSIASKLVDKNHMEDFVDEQALRNMISDFFTESGDFFQTVMSYLQRYGEGLVIGVKNFVLAIFISIYILSSKERLKAQTKKFTNAMLTSRGTSRLRKYISLCNKTFGGYFAGMIIDATIVGLITLVVLLVFSIPYAPLIATIVAITNVIPIFGPFIGAIPSFFIIFIADPKKGLLFLILILLIQQIDGNIIAPKILGDSTGLSSLTVIIAIIIMGEYFGLIGMIIGVPFFAVLVTIVKEFVEHRLRKKNLPTDTAEYYAADSLVDPHEKHVTVFNNIVNNITAIWNKLVCSIRKMRNKDCEQAPQEHSDKDTKEKSEDK